jgi:polar amino acid transport system substrate-binding protein
MKRLTTRICVLLAFGCAAVHAQTIRTVTEDTSYSYLQGGKVVGAASAVVEATLRRAGLDDYRMGLYPWARAYDMALQEPNVLIYLIARTPEREALFKWAGEITRIEYHFYKLRDRKDIVVHNLQDAKNYSVGVLRDDFRYQYLQAQGFRKVVVSAQNADNFRKLLNQQVQLVPLPERDAIQLSESAGIGYSRLEKVLTLDGLVTGLYMAYSRTTDDEIVARSRAAFDRLKAEGVVTKLMNAKH